MPEEVKHNQNTMFMPTLLDRLNYSAEKSKNGGHLNRQEYRQAVLRDLEWLLNCANLNSQLPLKSFPHTESSVINFGIFSYAGSRFVQSDLERVADAIKKAIIQYEPRIIKNSLEVKIIKNNEEKSFYNLPLFHIEALLSCEPYPIELLIRSTWDSENGSIKLYDSKKL